ncbi:MAG TPA: glycosyl hydrolase [Dongiaceae bacterium]|nr:glycosyl hydrolase [Dongiaceae bacterium]
MKSDSIFLPALASLLMTFTVAAAPPDALEAGFRNPPDTAKPQTWWHWMNGNITKAGITADLEAMKQVGLGGATIVNVDCEIPRGPVAFMSPEWREDFKFAVQEADRLGLKLCVENCAGWSSSGGPWNTPANGMQRLTSSEVKVTGPVHYAEALPQPATTLDYYRDIAVLAFPTPPVVTAGTPNPPPSLKDLIIKRATYGAADGSQVRDVTKRFAALIRRGEHTAVVNNGALGGDPAFGQVKQLVVEFELEGKPGTLTASEGDTVDLLAGTHQTPAQTSWRNALNETFVQAPPSNPARAATPIAAKDIVDLSAHLNAQGVLDWNVPAGEWTIVRLGYTPIGIDNHPAPKEGEGLECDKMSKAALDAHWDGFMQKVLDDIGPLAGRALDASLIDSYEVGNQDWTGNFREEFRKRRGYDPLKYLTTYTGRVVDDPAVSERFLWDMRRTVADLFADNYFGHFAELCRKHGLLNAVEPYTGPFESLQSGAPADVVMGEFWSGSQGHPSVKLAASIAHIYGKTIVGAESFTAAPDQGRWQNDPYKLKTLGDLVYCQGLNRYIFHRYAMQPWTNRWPGMTMGQWGFHFERTETWWGEAGAWMNYITHCQYLLQQGRAVADVAYFTGETAPVEMREGNPALPAGYDYDAVNADVLLHGAKVKNGRIVLASGVSYAVLVLPPNDANCTPEFLQGLRKLVRAGATVVGPRPQHSPSLTDYPKCDIAVTRLATELWGNCDGTNVTEHACGRGRVIWGQSLATVLAAQKLAPDFDFENGAAKASLRYAHRVDGNADIYFVSNQRRQFGTAECTFRVSGKAPELWHPDTGQIEPAPVWESHDGRTTVRLEFDPAGSVFVVFRQPAGKSDHPVAASGEFAVKPAALPKLEIQQARYEATDGSGGKDVTALLTAAIRDGQLIAEAGNDFLGGDPTLNHEKRLRVEYTLDGQPGKVTLREGETLTLPPTTDIGLAPQWEPFITAAGVPAVKVWSDGTVKLQTGAGKTLEADAHNLPEPEEITGGWKLSFPPHWGAPSEVTLDKLISWTDHPDSGVRYFSGTATYEKDIEIPADWLGAGREVWLDLGQVKNFAQVTLNGQPFEVLWKPPFRVNLAGAAKAGSNHLVVKVTNLWPNRLIGDEQLPPDVEWNGKQLKAWPQWLLDGKPSPTGRLTFTTWHHWTKNSPLLESGLLGPVLLRAAEIIPVQ